MGIFRRKPRVISAVVLPKRAVFFHALALMLPPDLRKKAAGRDFLHYQGDVSGITLTAMKIPFSRPLRTVCAYDLFHAFYHYDPLASIPAVEHGFLRHSPTLHARFFRAGVFHQLYLVQVRKTVYLFCFMYIREQYLPTVEAVISSMETVH